MGTRVPGDDVTPTCPGLCDGAPCDGEIEYALLETRADGCDGRGVVGAFTLTPTTDDAFWLDVGATLDREACDRSIGGSLVELFTVSFSFQYERVRARWVLCNEETAFNVFFHVSYVRKVRSLSIDKTAIDATNGRVVASDASTAFDRARSASRARTKERWVGAPVRRERCANS